VQVSPVGQLAEGPGVQVKTQYLFVPKDIHFTVLPITEGQTDEAEQACEQKPDVDELDARRQINPLVQPLSFTGSLQTPPNWLGPYSGRGTQTRLSPERALHSVPVGQLELVEQTLAQTPPPPLNRRQVRPVLQAPMVQAVTRGRQSPLDAPDVKTMQVRPDLQICLVSSVVP